MTFWSGSNRLPVQKPVGRDAAVHEAMHCLLALHLGKRVDYIEIHGHDGSCAYRTNNQPDGLDDIIISLGGPDYAEAFEIAMRLADGDERRAKRICDEQLRLIDDFVATYWGAITETAQTLRLYRRLTGTNVVDILKRSEEGRALLAHGAQRVAIGSRSRQRSAAKPDTRRRYEIRAGGVAVGEVVEAANGRWSAHDQDGKSVGTFASLVEAERALTKGRSVPAGEMRFTTWTLIGAAERREFLQSLCRADGYDPATSFGDWLHQVFLPTPPGPRGSGLFACGGAGAI